MAAPRVFQPLSTGITFALTEKAPADKIPLITRAMAAAKALTAASSSGTSR
jgi:branched-chain amino acid transport system substrate-binding protein